MKRTPLKRKSNREIPKLQSKCDKLLTPIVKSQKPKCESCGNETQVAHHWIEKSRSTYLRYDLRNLVALCHSCHVKIHNRFGSSIVGCLNVADIIIKKRGKKWREEMERDTYEKVQANKTWYQENLERLQKLCDSLPIKW